MKLQRIAIFGGTFDPPHVGHLILAEQACDQLNLDRLLWVLTPDPPHKQGRAITPAARRLALVQAAIAGNPSFALSRLDLDRPGPHYAVDTVALLQAEYPGAQIVYLIGEDSLRDLPTWYHPQALVQAVAQIGVLPRPGVETDLAALEQALPGLQAKLAWIQAPLIEISATDIRQRLRARRSIRYLVPDAVHEILTNVNSEP